MSFTLTPSHLDAVLSNLRAGDFPAFLEHVEPEVEWRMGASDEAGKGASGVYDLASFKERVLPLMGQMFEPGVVRHPCQSTDVIGNKAVVEDHFSAPMKNAHVYDNRGCLVMEFSRESGKIHKMRFYTDTQVLADAKRALGIEA